MKLSKYRDLVRKKDELLTKNQQKLEEQLKSERVSVETELEFKSCKEAYLRLKGREEHLSAEL